MQTNKSMTQTIPTSPRFSDFGAHFQGEVASTDRPVVCIQGLGFVGAAMALAVAQARSESGAPIFNVIGVDLPTPQGELRVQAVNRGAFPHSTTDRRIENAARVAGSDGNLVATHDPAAFAAAAVIVVDINLDVDSSDLHHPRVPMEGFRVAVREIGDHVQPGALVLVETTVPPGTCERVVRPELARSLKTRGLDPDSVHVAHSYERVMPGSEYLQSIVNFWRVYAGCTPAAAERAREFLEQIINYRDFPMTRLASTNASEMAKVLENSYRATTIAFMEEWGRFSEAIGVDIFSVIDAIRVRPTHDNMRQPGFGVGGYCLTKDPLFARFSALELFNLTDQSFEFSTRAVATNQRMPLVSLDRVQAALSGDLSGKRLLLLGVSYRESVGDTRYSPSETFVLEARRAGATVLAYDPLVSHWDELDWDLPSELPPATGFDAVVFAVGHPSLRELDLADWLGRARPVVFDANRVLSEEQWKSLAGLGLRTVAIGRGDLAS
jgi:nucleotide sugar dehydrogenase